MKKLLLEGAVYALENGGSLLRDAVTMYERGSYATAIVLAMFGREELGKFRMLRDMYEVAAAGGAVEVKVLTGGALFKHVEKQRQGMLSVVQRPEPGTRLDELLRAQFELETGSPEWQKVREELDEITEEQKKAIPQERHDLRMDTLYVGLSDDQSRWVRPQEVTADEARHAVEHAVCDHNVIHSRLQDAIDNDKAFTVAYRAWAARPSISAVKGPRL